MGDVVLDAIELELPWTRSKDWAMRITIRKSLMYRMEESEVELLLVGKTRGVRGRSCPRRIVIVIMVVETVEEKL